MSFGPIGWSIGVARRLGVVFLTCLCGGAMLLPAQSPSDLDNLKPSNSPAKRSDAVVKVISQTIATGNSSLRRVSIVLKIDDGWYIYANPVGNSEMAGSETVVSVVGNRGKLVDVTYPRGSRRQDKLLDQEIEYWIYEGVVKIEAKVELASGQDSAELAIRFGACSHRGSCLQPATVKLTVK